MATHWRIYGNETIACKLSKEDIPGFFKKQIVIGPNETALIVKNGEALEEVSGSSEKIAGLWDKVKSFFKNDDDVEIYIVDSSPFEFNIFLDQTSKKSFSENNLENYTQEGRDILKSSKDMKVDGVNISRSKSDEFNTKGQHLESTIDTSNVVLMGLTADNEIVTAECRFKVSILREDVKIFTGLLKGRTALATWDIAALVRDKLLAKVLIPKVAKFRSDELRGNDDLSSQITSEVKSEFLKSFNLFGLTLEDFNINWGLSEQDCHEIDKKRKLREEDAKEFAHTRQIRDMERYIEIEKTKITNLQSLKVANTQGDEDLKDMILATNINRDLMIKGADIDVARIDADVRSIKLGVEKEESNLRLEEMRNKELLRLDLEAKEYAQRQQNKLANIDAEDKEMAGMVRMQIQMATEKHERKMDERRQELDSQYRNQQASIEAEYKKDRIRLEEDLARMGMIERLIDKGLSTGDGDSSVLKTMLEQATEQSFVRATDDKVKSREEAKAAKHNMDTFKDAEDREREHQKDMTKLSADMMNAAKQPPANSNADTKEARKCSKCNYSLQSNWKACPECGEKIN